MPKKPTLRERFGDRCRALRQRAGISQFTMTEYGFSLSHYQKIERGVLDPRLSTVLKIAEVFGVDPSELVDGL